jgi:hypothetical protein
MTGFDSIVVAGSVLGALSSVAALVIDRITRRRDVQVRAMKSRLGKIEELTDELDGSGLPADHVNELRKTVSRLQRDLEQMPLRQGA